MVPSVPFLATSTQANFQENGTAACKRYDERVLHVSVCVTL